MNFSGMPAWEIYLLTGILIFIGISASAVVLTRTGRSPYWAFILLAPYIYEIPFIQVAAIWYLAFCAWPQPKDSAK